MRNLDFLDEENESTATSSSYLRLPLEQEQHPHSLIWKEHQLRPQNLTTGKSQLANLIFGLRMQYMS